MTEQAEQLRNALLDMVSRYGDSTALIYEAVPRDGIRYLRAARRQYTAIMRLSRALAELSART